MSEIILYDKPECPFCWKVRLVLEELNLEHRIINYLSSDHEEKWRSLTPNQTVPVLQHGDIIIYESDVILEYLQDLTGKLLPETPDKKVQARLINKFSDNNIGKGLREVIFEKRGKPESEWDLDRIEKGISLFYQSLEFLSVKLADNEYFCEQYSLPEAALTARFGLAESYGVPIPERFNNLKQWFERMKLRPSFKNTQPA